MQGEEPIRVDMFIKERRQGAPVGLVELLQKLVLHDAAFDEQGIDEHQAVLQELEAQRRDLLLVPTIGGKAALPPIAEEIIGGIPAFATLSPSLTSYRRSSEDKYSQGRSFFRLSPTPLTPCRWDA